MSLKKTGLVAAGVALAQPPAWRRMRHASWGTA